MCGTVCVTECGNVCGNVCGTVFDTVCGTKATVSLTSPSSAAIHCSLQNSI